jgi:diguanylate cyclase (GGDEF)-like protein
MRHPVLGRGSGRPLWQDPVLGRGSGRPLWQDPVLIFLFMVGALTTAWYLAGAGDTLAQVKVVWLLYVPLDVALVVLAWRVSAAPGSTVATRRFWRALSIAAVCFLVGDSYQLAGVLRHPRPDAIAGGIVQSAFFIAALAGLTFVMLRYPLAVEAGRERVRFWLDSFTVLVGGAVLTWCFAVDPAADPIDLVAVLAGAGIALVTLFAAVRLALSRESPATQLAAAPMIAAMFLQVVAVYVTPPQPGDELSAGVFLTRLLPSVLVAAGPRIQELQARANPATFAARRQKPYSALPYVAITATFGALIMILPGGVDGRVWGVVAGAVIITSLVVARQLLAFQANIGLIKRLDGTLLDLREHEKRLVHNAAHDTLTSLLNREAFAERVAGALRRGVPVALLLIDLDDFKTINDTLGHSVGDGLLIAVARRLRSAVRPDDVVARLGGDEFAILLGGVPGGHVEVLARRVLASLANPVSVGGQDLLVHASIGAAVAGADDDLASLLRNADIALYEAKDRGKGGYVRYVVDMRARLFETAELGARLREAINDGEFELVYQPIVQFHDGRIVGTEALVRWHRPGVGVVPPAEFITAAERTGLIVPLGRWVLRQACHQAAAWVRDFGGLAPRSVSVNVSGRQFREPGFVQDVAGALAESGLAAERLTIEMIETAVLDGGEASKTLHELRGLGVRLALDDFGTAASSLGLLLTCPVTSLKLDRSFVEGIVTVTRQAAVATAVAQIAQALDLDVVAEGIETGEQAELLQRLGYRHAQGFLFHHPMPARELPALWLADAGGDARRSGLSRARPAA